MDHIRGMDARRLPFINLQDDGVLIAGGLVFHPGIAIHTSGNGSYHTTVHGVHFISGLPRWWELRAWWQILQSIRAALNPAPSPKLPDPAPAIVLPPEPEPIRVRFRKRYRVENRSSPVCMGVQRRVVSPDHVGPWVTGNTAAAWKAYKAARRDQDAKLLETWKREAA